MKEYKGKSSKHYKQTVGKRLLLIPAVKRAIAVTNVEKKLLDIGCGNADFFNVAKSKGYRYYGLDSSEDMLKRAKEDYPQGEYVCASSIDFASGYKVKFDVIIISMLFPSFDNKNNIIKTLKEAKKVLNDNGKILIGIPHPSFDNYMLKGLFEKKGIKTDFKDYFTSGQKYIIHYDLGSGFMDFEDYHWTLGDYVSFIKKSGLILKNIDECVPVKSADGISKKVISEKRRFPTYMVLEAGLK